jgi:two-component system, cell cycle sensor histidine kinase DivJ
VQANNGSDRGQGGSGLGLSVVSGLAQLHGGRLKLASTLGEGTIATIILPLEGLSESGEAPPACSTVSAA